MKITFRKIAAGIANLGLQLYRFAVIREGVRADARAEKAWDHVQNRKGDVLNAQRQLAAVQKFVALEQAKVDAAQQDAMTAENAAHHKWNEITLDLDILPHKVA